VIKKKMATKKEIMQFFNKISIKEYGKKYKSLSDYQAAKVRKKAVRLAFRKKKKGR